MAYVGTYRALLAGGVARPALVLDFIGLNVLDRRITFSRGTNATLTDSTGKITYAPANLLTYSEQFDNAAWTQNNVTVTANSATAPNGTATADLIIATAVSGNHQASQAATTTATATTYSIYAKQGGYSWCALGITDSGSTIRITYFNLATGVVGTTATGITAAIQNVGGGWYRCSVTVSTALAGSNTCRMYVTNADATLSFTGDGTSGIYLWGAQLEPVTYQTTPSTYQATTSTAYYGPRFDYDPVTLAPRGLLIEEQRTNLVLYSSAFTNAVWTTNNPGVAVLPVVTASAGTSPDGTNNACRIQLDCGDISSATNRSIVSQPITVANATAYRGSVYIKAYNAGAVGKTVRIASDTGIGSTVYTLTSSWQRVDYGGGTTTGTVSNFIIECRGTFTTQTADILIWGAQLEAGSFATSYIPTVASTVTRSADVATMTGANFSSWYNQTQGAFVVQFDMVGGSAVNHNNQIVLSAVTDASNRHLIYNGSSQITGYTVVGGVDQAYLTTGSLAANTTSKMSYAYQVNSFAASQNGGSVSTDTSGSLPSPASFGIGSSGYGTAYLNGHIRTIAYYPDRLSNTQLQSLTT